EVLNQLFGNTLEGADEFAEAFLECLCSIFAELGEVHIQLLKGEWDGEELVSGKLLENALTGVQYKYPQLRIDRLERAVVDFFVDRNLKVDELKWNLAQNYYVAKALGLDPAGHLLSADLFSNGVFYLDTNVLIAALEPEEWAHGSTKALFHACQRLSISLRVCEISINELDAFLKDQWDILVRLGGKVHKGLLKHIRSTFLRKYEQLASMGKVPDLDEVFRNFDDPVRALSRLANVQLIEDPWFEQAESIAATPRWMAAVQRASAVKRIREKTQSAILHDAILLQWIQRDVDKGLNSWLVTLDTSLPMVDTEPWSSQTNTHAITLVALLQWMSPLSGQVLSPDSAASIFAEAIKYQVLPRATFFSLKDIVLFTEIAHGIDNLPNKTLEALYEHLSKVAANYDLSDARDREKFASVVARYLSDPANAQRIEKERREQEQAIMDLNRKVQELERTARKSKAQMRLAILLLIVLVLALLFGYLVHLYGEGENLFAKLVRAWPFFLSLGGLTVILGWFVIGREGLRELGWAIRKLFDDIGKRDNE
ncbi:MAG TPA: hypothetical protein PKD55_23640, partial [Bellilinea sp.]|nr:hypothetical protein [Bellilinea sp.]